VQPLSSTHSFLRVDNLVEDKVDEISALGIQRG
jgi:hypothetical protein